MSLLRCFFFIALISSSVSYTFNANLPVIRSSLRLLSPSQKFTYQKYKGLFCEYIAYNLMKEKLARDGLSLRNNIRYVYKRDNKTTSGELDMVAFDDKNRARFIFEIKCSSNQRKAKQRGYHQLTRFKNTVLSSMAYLNHGLRIFANRKEQFNVEHFKDARFIVLTPKPSDDKPAQDDELDITVEEITSLHEFLRDF